MKKSARSVSRLAFPRAPAALRAQDLQHVRGGNSTVAFIPCVRVMEPCYFDPCVRPQTPIIRTP